MDELNLHNTYFFANIVENEIFAETSFWNFPDDVFQERALNFNKETLLHLYIETTIWNYFNYEIRKCAGDNVQCIFFLKKIFEQYNIDSPLFVKIGEDEESTNFKILEQFNQTFHKKWIKHEPIFRNLFKKIAEDVFYIFFGNRKLLLLFNQIVADQILCTVLPEEVTNKKGLIKRKNIPHWVKKAVFSRDKGRCTFCTKDLTGIIAVDQKQHYDHIVPLNLGGVNDPTNIQLLCEKCNLKKSGDIIKTSNLYLKWWT